MKNFFKRHWFNLRHLGELTKYGEKDSVGSPGLHTRHNKDFGVK